MAKYVKKKQKKNSGRVLLLIILMLLLALLIGLISLFGPWGEPTQEQTEEPDQISIETTGEPQSIESETETMPEPTEPQKIELPDGLVIHHISGYAGIYMEDGSDEPVSDVMMILLENTSERDLQLARISIEYSSFTAEFEVTNLPAGEKLVALEKNRHPEVSEKYQSVETKSVVSFPEPMGLEEERVQIKGYRGTLEVTNISAEDITGEIYIYYKNSAKDLLYGGITYRVPVKGGLEAGKSATVIAGHYTPENSRILLVDCGD